MRIDSSNISLFGQSNDVEKTTKKRVLVQQKPTNEHTELRKQFQQQLNQLKKESQSISTSESDDCEWQMSEKDYNLLTFLESIFSELTGKDVKFQVPKKIKVNRNAYDQNIHNLVQSSFMPPKIYHEEFSYHKKSSMEFNANGKVVTKDGREIEFNFNLKHQSEITYTSSRTVIEGDKLIDPLAISFDDNLPALTDRKYSFDLDFDGKEDQISFLTKGSGFLSIDLNNDGKINDGSELFGTRSGSGFKDLAVYDKDNNGWIDENDDVFNRLRIFSKDENGNDHLIAIGEKGIGAIFLGSVSTEFDLLGSNFSRNGVVRESGIYLNEDGSAHNLHHVDIQV